MYAPSKDGKDPSETEEVSDTSDSKTESLTANEKTDIKSADDQEVNTERVETALEATAFNLYDELSMRGFESDPTQLVDVWKREEGDYQVSVNVDLNSLFHTSGMTVRDQDLHTADELGRVDKIIEDPKSIYEMASIIEENVQDFYDEVGKNEETSVDISIDIRGEDNSGYKFNIDTLEEDVVSATKDFVQSPYEEGRHCFHPMEYEDLMLVRERETVNLEIEDEENTIQYLDEGIFEINGEVPQSRSENEKLGRFNGEDVYVDEINPLYVQDRKDVNRAVV